MMTRQILMLVKSATVDEARAAALRIPKGKGDAEVESPLGGTSAAVGDNTIVDVI